MYTRILLVSVFVITSVIARAQMPKAITMEQYEKAKKFVVKDLDNDTYVKFENNTFVLDRYEGKKPYFVTGDDGLKKRIDLYNLIARADGSVLGTIIYYTNEKGKLYTACLPSVSSDPKVWERYFEDIHATDKEEKFYVLKLSYILSRELSFQQYKASLKGKELDRSEAGTYGNDICFPGEEDVAMADGSRKLLKNIQPGDEVISVNPQTHRQEIVRVRNLSIHEEKNYAITSLTLICAREKESRTGRYIHLFSRKLEATPNHPVQTGTGVKPIGKVSEGEQLICRNAANGKYETFTVWEKQEKARGMQKVYNIDAEAGSTFVINGVMVMQKQQEQ